MMETLRWVALNRKDLPGLIADGELPANARHMLTPLMSVEEVVVGCLGGDTNARPSVVVLSEDSAREILAWLATYSPASFPITQALRTLTTFELKNGSQPSLSNPRNHVDFSYWPCVVLGEILGQGEYSPNIDSLALSRANACFGFAQARADELHGIGSAFSSACERRLRMLEADGLFVRRAISVDELAPIWAWTRSKVTEEPIQGELVRLIGGMNDADEAGSVVVTHPRLQGIGFDSRSLTTGPIEARVRAYQAFVSSLESLRDPSNSRSSAMLLAAAAACVGNGTSHISLLDEIGKKLPAVYAWFGLFAAITGPKGWDPLWNRAVNSVVRLLRSRFEFSDSPIFDLSWVEYDFVREIPNPIEFVRHFPKFYPKALSIEIVPGAACQLRMIDDRPTSRPMLPKTNEIGDPVRSPPSHQPEALSPQLSASLLEIDRAIARTQLLIRQAIVASGAPAQSGLFDSGPKKKKRGSSRKNAKNEGQ